MKFEATTAPPQPSSAENAKTKSVPALRLEACFSLAKKPIPHFKFVSRLGLQNQAESLGGPLLNPLLPLAPLRTSRLRPTARPRAKNKLPLNDGINSILASRYLHLLTGRVLFDWRDQNWRWEHPECRNLIPSGIRIYVAPRSGGILTLNRCKHEWGDFLQVCEHLPCAGTARFGSARPPTTTSG